MKARKLILFVILIFIFLLEVVYAQNVTVSADVTIYVPGVDRYFTLLSTSNALDQLQVSTYSFTVTTSLSSGMVQIKSTDRLDIGGSHNSANITLSSCTATESVLTIYADPAVVSTVTVTPPTTGTIYCQTSSGELGGGTGGTGTGGGTGGSVSPPSGGDTGVITPPPAVPETPTGDYFTDLRRVRAGIVEKIDELVALMLKVGTYVVPADGHFMPYSRTSRYFLTQMALAVAGNSCGDSVNPDNCLAAADESGFFEVAVPHRYPTRCEAYGMLLTAANIPLIDRAAITKADLPIDIKGIRSRCAQVFVTAKLYGIASQYSDNRSDSAKPVARYLAALFASRALNAKALMGAGELPKNVIVELTNKGFSPAAVTINVGDTVTFVNKMASEAMRVASVDNELRGFDSRSFKKPGRRYSYLFDEEGIFEYRDELHLEFTGSVTVNE